MTVAKTRTSILLFTFISIIPVSVATITIGISSLEVKTSDSFSITCTVSDLSDDVIFYRGIIEIGRCAASAIPGLPGFCAAGFTQNITTNITTYSVASANATKDEGTWTCQHPPESSNGLGLTVYGFPANPIVDNQAYLPNSIDTTNMDSTQFTLNVSECVNPAPTITWRFFQDCEGTSISPISITSTSAGDPAVDCSAPYSAYKSTVKVTDMKKVVGNGDYCYKVRSVVEYPGTSFINITNVFSQNITFTSRSPDNPKSNTVLIIGVVTGILVLIVIALIMLMIYFKIYKRKAKKTPVGSAAQLVPPGPKGIPLEPGGPLKIKTGQNHVEFEWKSPKSDGGSQITEYIVEMKGIKFDTWEPIARSPEIKLQVPMDKFQDREVMLIRVRAKNEKGLSKPLLAQDPFKLHNSLGIPLAPRGPLRIKTGQNHVEFEWKSPISDGESQITEYIVEMKGIELDTWEPIASSPDIKLQVPMDTFKDREVMSFRVRAKNEKGLSKPLFAQEPFKLHNSLGIPLEPRGPLKIKTGHNHVEFEWKSPISDGGSEVTEYIVEVHGIKFDTWEPFASSAEMKLQVPMDKFKDRKVMSFRVRAKNENGLSKPLLAQEPFNLHNLFDLLSDRPVQVRGPAGQGSLLDEVPPGRKLPEPV